MSQRIALVSLVVSDYDAAIAYYVGMLGFALSADQMLAGGKRWVVAGPKGGGTSLLLAKAEGPGQAAAIGNQAGGRVFLFLTTDDFAGDHARLVARGVEFLEAPRSEAYGTVAVFRDPFGNRWDLIEPCKTEVDAPS
jgi:catechol 2,3-dioxygenase-like lactoylglutathione lyase family enzyme